jgi:predicted DNA-binding transcriptional regulator AlpA
VNPLFEQTSNTSRATNELETAQWLGLSVATLRSWRHRGMGPNFVKFGRAVRYLRHDVEAFIETSLVRTTGRTAPARHEQEVAR